ncbi:MAG: hypothetical protein H6707_16165 [Deltaproteobacteria bacterium]|nr:hypothetical protein [Deltaproteobacteria bacterium]
MSDLGRRLQETIDAVAGRYADDSYRDEVSRARETFDTLRGRVFEDDDIFPAHIANFLEWYVIERPLDRIGVPPVVLALQQPDVSTAERALLDGLRFSQRSVYRVERAGRRPMLLLDLIRRTTFGLAHVAPERVSVGEIIEGRVVPIDGGAHLGPMLLFHPMDARMAIEQLIATRRDEPPSATIARLAQMRLNFSRFRNISAAQIYSRSFNAAGEGG